MPGNNIINGDEIKNKVKEFIVNNFLMGDHSKSIGEDDSFLEQEIVDSTGILELVSFIEDTFGFKVQDEELIPDNLDTLNNIIAFISQKQKG